MSNIFMLSCRISHKVKCLLMNCWRFIKSSVSIYVSLLHLSAVFDLLILMFLIIITTSGILLLHSGHFIATSVILHSYFLVHSVLTIGTYACFYLQHYILQYDYMCRCMCMYVCACVCVCRFSIST